MWKKSKSVQNAQKYNKIVQKCAKLCENPKKVAQLEKALTASSVSPAFSISAPLLLLRQLHIFAEIKLFFDKYLFTINYTYI